MTLTKQQKTWLKIPPLERCGIIQEAVTNAIAKAVQEYEEKETKTAEEPSGSEDDPA
jgi:hypothetical protein